MLAKLKDIDIELGIVKKTEYLQGDCLTTFLCNLFIWAMDISLFCYHVNASIFVATGNHIKRVRAVFLYRVRK